MLLDSFEGAQYAIDSVVSPEKRFRAQLTSLGISSILLLTAISLVTVPTFSSGWQSQVAYSPLGPRGEPLDAQKSPVHGEVAFHVSLHTVSSGVFCSSSQCTANFYATCDRLDEISQTNIESLGRVARASQSRRRAQREARRDGEGEDFTSHLLLDGNPQALSDRSGSISQRALRRSVRAFGKVPAGDVAAQSSPATGSRNQSQTLGPGESGAANTAEPADPEEADDKDLIKVYQKELEDRANRQFSECLADAQTGGITVPLAHANWAPWQCIDYLDCDRLTQLFYISAATRALSYITLGLLGFSLACMLLLLGNLVRNSALYLDSDLPMVRTCAIMALLASCVLSLAALATYLLGVVASDVGVASMTNAGQIFYRAVGSALDLSHERLDYSCDAESSTSVWGSCSPFASLSWAPAVYGAGIGAILASFFYVRHVFVVKAKYWLPLDDPYAEIAHFVED